jgi:hypothetical protein
MMECVTCNKSSLFALRPKTLEKQGEKNNPFEARFFSNVLKMKDIN